MCDFEFRKNSLALAWESKEQFLEPGSVSLDTFLPNQESISRKSAAADGEIDYFFFLSW